MLIDTHCHLDATEFNHDRVIEIEAAIQVGVEKIVVPAVCAENFDAVIALSQQYPACYYALGWHPMYIHDAQPSDMQQLSKRILKSLDEAHHKLVAVGEIGLDFFVTKHNAETQTYFFVEQLKIAQTFDLPVILHVRKSVDEILKYLRRYPVAGGIAHAFNGSLQQAETFIKLGFKLGFGGAMTYTRALKIRELAKILPLESIVLETDAPDIPPEWLVAGEKNSPKELVKIAEVLAELKGVSMSQILDVTGKNAQQILPNLADLCTPLEVTL